jgi:hypothetical protein
MNVFRQSVFDENLSEFANRDLKRGDKKNGDKKGTKIFLELELWGWRQWYGIPQELSKPTLERDTRTSKFCCRH